MLSRTNNRILQNPERFPIDFRSRGTVRVLARSRGTVRVPMHEPVGTVRCKTPNDPRTSRTNRNRSVVTPNDTRTSRTNRNRSVQTPNDPRTAGTNRNRSHCLDEPIGTVRLNPRTSIYCKRAWNFYRSISLLFHFEQATHHRSYRYLTSFCNKFSKFTRNNFFRVILF